MPQCAQCVRQRSAWTRNIWLAWGATAALFAAGAVARSPLLGLLACLLSVGALVFSFVDGSYQVAGTVTGDGYWVVLRRVHPDFVQAHLHAIGQLPQQVAARPWDTFLPQ